MADGLPTLAQILTELQQLDREGRLRGGATSLKGGGRYRFTKGLNISRLDWPGVGSYWLTREQVGVVSVLLEAYFESSNPDVKERTLLTAISSKAAHLRDVFQGTGSEAWGTLIVQGRTTGAYRIAPPKGRAFPIDDDEGDEEDGELTAD